jgi:uncharacterized membrane protein YtjA (UPF0391 family)
MSWQQIQTLLAFIASVLGFLGATIGLYRALAERPHKRSSWKAKVLFFLGRMALVLSLPVGNILIIGITLNWITRYYFEAESLDLLVTSRGVFLSTVTLQTLLVSAYSVLWMLTVRRIFGWRPNPKPSANQTNLPRATTAVESPTHLNRQGSGDDVKSEKEV